MAKATLGVHEESVALSLGLVLQYNLNVRVHVDVRTLPSRK